MGSGGGLTPSNEQAGLTGQHGHGSSLGSGTGQHGTGSGTGHHSSGTGTGTGVGSGVGGDGANTGTGTNRISGLTNAVSLHQHPSVNSHSHKPISLAPHVDRQHMHRGDMHRQHSSECERSWAMESD